MADVSHSVANQNEVKADDVKFPSASKKSATLQKKKKSTAVASSKSKPNHPPTSEMVNNAIKNLKERGGSSLQAIKKYLASNYKIDSEKMSPFIKKYIKSAVVSGTLVQTKGKGANGSFKISGGSSADKPTASKGAKKTAVSAKTSSAAGTKRSKAPTKKTAPKKAAAVSSKKNKLPPKKQPTTALSAASSASDKKTDAKQSKSLSKTKKTKKLPTKKPKAPKPKKTKPAGAGKTSSPKKIVAGSPKKK